MDLRVMSRMHYMRAVCAGVSLSILGTAALAQDYPSKPIKIVIPWGAGTTPDPIFRAIGQSMARKLGQPVVIENKPGATGAVGADYVAASAADGYTLLEVASGYVLARALQGLPFDANKNMAPIAMVSSSLLFLFVSQKALPNVRTLNDFVGYARANPQKVLPYGSNGIGSTTHMAMILIEKKLNLNLNHVPYKGTTQYTIDFLSGDLFAMVDSLNANAAYVKAGQTIPLMVLLPQRTSLLPEVPTARELGHPDLEVIASHGIAAPFGTPRPIVEKLSATIRQALSEPEVEKVITVGNGVMYLDPARYAESLNETYVKWGKVIRENNIKAE